MEVFAMVVNIFYVHIWVTSFWVHDDGCTGRGDDSTVYKIESSPKAGNLFSTWQEQRHKDERMRRDGKIEKDAPHPAKNKKRKKGHSYMKIGLGGG